MKKTAVKIISFALTIAIVLSVSCTSFAKKSAFDDGAYASIVTGSDFQDSLYFGAYERFENILYLMKNDGLETPHSMLMGGDFTKILFDYATPGITLIRKGLSEVYPDMNTNNLVCVQGNHDNTSSGFTKTGFYDMGEYCLYAINENDFTWMQRLRPLDENKVKALADDIEFNLNEMIESNDLRPVIVMTHVPLHYTDRSEGGDNKFASYIFDVLNKEGEKLDITFLFGHNHSSDYDDYIGGSVNFLAPGETILIPDAEKSGEGNYTEEKLNFVYTNFGYIGYSGNTLSDTSTNELTIGVIRLCNNSINYIKYSDDGLFTIEKIERKNPVNHSGDVVNADGTVIFNRFLFDIQETYFKWLFNIYYNLVSKLAK